MPPIEEVPSLLQELISFRLSPRLRVRCLQLHAEAAAMMTVALLAPLVSGFRSGGTVALCLIAVSLMLRMQFLIDEHRDNVWQGRFSSRRSDLIFSASAAALFLGLFLTICAFSLAYSTLAGRGALHDYFEFILRLNHLDASVPLARRFSSLPAILSNNFLVLLTTILLAALYRALGVILVLTWNAFQWAVLFVVLAEQALAQTQGSGARFVARGAAAILPHLVGEAIAYILGAMGALFFSKALTLYAATDPRFLQTLRSCARLLLLASLLLLLAGFAERVVPGLLL